MKVDGWIFVVWFAGLLLHLGGILGGTTWVWFLPVSIPIGFLLLVLVIVAIAELYRFLRRLF